MPWVELELPNFHNVVFKQEICTNRSTVIGEIVSTHKIVGGSIRQLFHEKDEFCAACSISILVVSHVSLGNGEADKMPFLVRFK